MSIGGGQLSRFAKFGLVGLLGGGLQVSVLILLTKCVHMPAAAATAIAVEIAVLHNFLWHERFTWRDRRLRSLRKRAVRLARFHLGNGFVSLVGNTAFAYYLVEQLDAPVLLSAMVGIGVCSVVNFVLADRWVWEPA